MIFQLHQFAQRKPPSIAPEPEKLAELGTLKEGISSFQLWPLPSSVPSFSHLCFHWPTQYGAREVYYKVLRQKDQESKDVEDSFQRDSYSKDNEINKLLTRCMKKKERLPSNSEIRKNISNDTEGNFF